LDFRDVILKRRSVRKFKKDPVPEKALENILDSGRWAPSAGNCQPWHFVVITDADVKNEVALMCTRFSKEHWRSFPPERAKYLAERGGTWEKSYMRDIPVLIAACYSQPEKIRETLAAASVWMAVENILLAATNEGLGSCVYTFSNAREENKLRQILHASPTDKVACIVQIGYASAEPPLPSRKKLENLVSYAY
jgi:nitroreductase